MAHVTHKQGLASHNIEICDQGAIAAAEAKGPETQAAIEESQAEHAQLQLDLKNHKEESPHLENGGGGGV